MSSPGPTPADQPPACRWPTVPYQADAGAGYRAAIGLIALANDFTIEPELVKFLPDDGVALYANRIRFPAATTIDTLAAMEQDISATAALINPGAKLDVVAFGCTSGTIAIGDRTVADRILQVRPNVRTTDPITAGLTGLRALGCQRIVVLTPYIDEVNVMVEQYVRERGFEVVAGAGFKIHDAVELGRVSPESVYQAAVALGAADVDGVFVSCTALRVSPVLARIESVLGKPVVASNQAIAWHAMRLAGCDDRPAGYGRLMDVRLPERPD